MESVVIVSAVRTPVGTMGGVLRDLSAVDLATAILDAAVERAGVSKAWSTRSFWVRPSRAQTRRTSRVLRH